MTRTRPALWLVGMAAALPAVFWGLYTLWNTALDQPPALGPVTAFSVIYLLMLPATAIVAVRWRPSLPGSRAYIIFLLWIAVAAVWRHPDPATDARKVLLIDSLAALTAAQILVGGRIAELAFGASLMATTVGLSAWTIARALASGFLYRADLPINPNFVATLIAPGVLVGAARVLAYEGARASGRGRGAVLAVTLVGFYATLLLGSRGVFIAMLVGVLALVARLRPTFRRARALAVSSVAVMLIAQFPVVPNTLWRAGWQVASRLRETASELPWTSTTGAQPGAAAPALRASIETAADTRPFNDAAAESTALGRFDERGTGSFNLRAPLWRAGAAYAISSPVRLLFGGGIGMAAILSTRANPVFHNVHNAALQLLDDTGLVGLALLAWAIGRVGWRLMTAVSTTTWSSAWLALLAFWVVLGLTSTVTDLHVCWLTLGVAAASAAGMDASADAARA